MLACLCGGGTSLGESRLILSSLFYRLEGKGQRGDRHCFSSGVIQLSFCRHFTLALPPCLRVPPPSSQGLGLSSSFPSPGELLVPLASHQRNSSPLAKCCFSEARGMSKRCWSSLSGDCHGLHVPGNQMVALSFGFRCFKSGCSLVIIRLGSCA